MANSDPQQDSAHTQKTVSNLAFYKFFHVDNPEQTKRSIRLWATRLNLKGTVLVAPEGVNGMLAGNNKNADAFINWLHTVLGIEKSSVKISYSDRVPFQKLVVKVKKEIVAMRVDGVDASCKTAKLLPPETFRDWIRSDEPMILLDTRNRYEYDLGTFVGAIDPDTRTFNEFPEWVKEHRDEIENKRVVMFCTGGIRCEKASSWMLDQGIEDIYQLDGGILNYFLSIPDAEKDWQGDLFVFDNRVAIDTKSCETDAELCKICGLPIKTSAGIVHEHSEEEENKLKTRSKKTSKYKKQI